MSSLAAQKIITKGLDCGNACDGIITTFFSLYCTDTGPVVDSGGGPYPYPAWNRYEPGEVQDLYQPVDPDLIVPLDKEAEYFQRHRIIVMKINIGDVHFEKEYVVPVRPAKIILTVANFFNTTKNRIELAVSGMRRIVTNAVVRVKNLRITRK